MTQDEVLRTIGQTLPDTVTGRDAVHIAILPVVCSDKMNTLQPGQPIGLTGEGEASSNAHALIGVVDPFLQRPVAPGERFWMFLQPGTIKSLRHEWTHEFIPDDPKLAKLNAHVPPMESITYMENFALEVGLRVDQLLAGAKDYLENGECMSNGSQWESVTVPDVFWDHYGAITGTDVMKHQRDTFFSCSC